MSKEKPSSLGPVLVGEIECVHQDADCPIHADKQSQTQGRAVAAQQLRMQRQRERAEGQNGQHRKPALYPEQFAVKGHQLLQVLAPAQLVGHLKAGQ